MPEPENRFLWTAYAALRTSRGGLGGPIPFSEIATYCDWLGLTCPVQRGRLARVVAAMDRAEGDFNG